MSQETIKQNANEILGATNGGLIRIYINGVLQTLDATDNGDIYKAALGSTITNQ